MKELFTITIMILVLAGCTSSQRKPSAENIQLLKAVEKSLRNSNEIASLVRDKSMAELERKSQDVKTADKANIFKPKVVLINNLADNDIKFLNETIDSLVDFVKQGAASSVDANFASCETFFFLNNRGRKIIHRLRECRKNMLDIDSSGKGQFESTLPLDTVLSNEQLTDEKLAELYFKGLNFLEAKILLIKSINKIQNSVFLLIDFWNRRIAYFDEGYEIFSVVAVPNATYFKPGQQLKIIAGVGSFTTAGHPTVMIDNKIIPINSENVAEYKCNVGGQRGKYLKKVVIDYWKAVGARDTITQIIEYEVADCPAIK